LHRAPDLLVRRDGESGLGPFHREPVELTGARCRPSSVCSFERVAGLVAELFDGSPTFIDRNCTERRMSLDDVLIVPPYTRRPSSTPSSSAHTLSGSVRRTSW
jgi:hypothetical protein